MSKNAISKGFAKFLEKNLKPGSAFDTARKAEAMANGCPLPCGTIGIAIVGTIECTETKVKPDGTGGDPFIRVTLEVETPEDYMGKTLSGPGLMFTIKDGPNSTAADAFGRVMDFFEGLGLPREIRTEMTDFEPVIEYFTEVPRRVEYNVLDDSDNKYNRSGKNVRAYVYISQDEIQTAETKPLVTATESTDDPSKDYCTYLNKKYEILDYNAELEQYKLKNVLNGMIRDGVPKDKVQLS